MSAGESVGALIDDPESDDLAGASNVMVVASSLDDGARKSYYGRVLPDGSAVMDVLAVEYRRTPQQFVDEWDRFRAESPRRFGIVSVDVSPTASTGADVERGAVAHIESPDDLTGVGMKVGRYLDRYGDSNTVLTFESLTLLLQYVDLERAFRFLTAITSQIRQLGAVAHYHVDPNAHEDRELATLASLFDAVARFRDGEWETRRR